VNTNKYSPLAGAEWEDVTMENSFEDHLALVEYAHKATKLLKWSKFKLGDVYVDDEADVLVKVGNDFTLEFDWDFISLRKGPKLLGSIDVDTLSDMPLALNQLINKVMYR
jgi:hypothetical protein